MMRVVLSKEEADWIVEGLQEIAERVGASPQEERDRATLEHVLVLLRTHIKVAPTIDRKDVVDDEDEG